MNVRQLEKLLIFHGAPTSFLDTVTRVLRAESRLPIGGRGPYAPQIGPDAAAWVMLALAGTDVAAQAGHALHRLLELRLPTGIAARYAPEFVDAVQILLGSPEWAGEVAEIRVGRSHALSQIIYHDGTVEAFVAGEMIAANGSMRFRSEGIIGGGLLHQVAIDLAGDVGQKRGLGD